MRKQSSFKNFTLMIAAIGSLATFTSSAESLLQFVSFNTTDKITIRGIFAKPKSISGSLQSDKLPAVIFLHQGGSSKSEWTSLPLFQQVVNNQMIALAIDIRGHGESSGTADFPTIFDDPNQSPRDLAAAIKYLIDSNLVDSDRIAIVGASIGANLAAMAAGNNDYSIKTAVAMSAKTSAIYNLSGVDKSVLKFKTLYLIAAELEQEGKRALWAKEIYDITKGDRELEVVKGSHRHGVSIFKDAPHLQTRILQWLKDTLYTRTSTK